MIKVLLISTVAALGGLAVFVGLWLEKIGDREEYQAIDDFRKSKIHRKIGERLVRWGVFAEMLLGFGVAALEGWEALNNNPLNQPVADISVSIVVNLAGTNFEHINDPYELRLNNWVMLLDNKTMFQI